jgi:ferredoxin
MGLGDMLKKAFENDAALPPPTNPGLKNGPAAVTVQFLPAKKTVRATGGAKLMDVASKAGAKIKYSCKKGDCRTCEVNFDGTIVKACQAYLPTKEGSYTVVVPLK